MINHICYNIRITLYKYECIINRRMYKHRQSIDIDVLLICSVGLAVVFEINLELTFTVNWLAGGSLGTLITVLITSLSHFL